MGSFSDEPLDGLACRLGTVPSEAGSAFDAHRYSVEVSHAREPFERFRVGGGKEVDVHTARLVREAPAAAVSPTVGKSDGPGVISSVISTPTSERPDADVTTATSSSVRPPRKPRHRD